jgi:hypothetical protein
MDFADVFNNPAFGMIEMSRAINLQPNNYGRLREMNLFPPNYLHLRTIGIEEQSGVLNLLPTKPLGSPGTVANPGPKRKMRSLTVPHIPHDDAVTAADVPGVRVFDTASQLETVANVVAKKLQAMRDKHAITLENLRWGALRGVVLDADGSEIYNFFDEFGITQKTVTFTLSSDTFDVKKACLDLKRYMEVNLLGEQMTNIHVFVDDGFFDAFTSHPKVVAAYDRWQDGAAARNDMRTNFVFAGVTFEEHLGLASNSSGTTYPFVPADSGLAFPLGTINTFSTEFAPADFMESVNSTAMELYAKQEIAKYGRGVDIHTQSNPLPVCRRPALLVKIETA